jgi:hypothetical protein
MTRKIRLGSREIRLPQSVAARVALGALLVLGGLLWFLPILGLWMFPLGVLVLSRDVAAVRRLRRRVEVRLGRWRQGWRNRGQRSADPDGERRGLRD